MADVTIANVTYYDVETVELTTTTGETVSFNVGESLPRHNLITSSISTLNGDTFAIESGQFRMGYFPSLVGSDLNSMEAFTEGVVKADSFVGVTGSASLLGDATAEDIAEGKTAVTSSGVVVGAKTDPEVYDGTVI